MTLLRSPQVLQIARFAMVGVVNTATFYGFYLALHPLMPYFLAYTAAFVLSMIGSFFLNTYFTYRTRPTWRKFLLFPLTNLTNYVVTSVGVYVFVEWAHMNDKIAPLVAAAAAIPFTYVLSRRILTRGARQDADASEGAEGAQVAEDTEAGPADGTAAGPAAPQQHPQDLAPVTRP